MSKKDRLRHIVPAPAPAPIPLLEFTTTLEFPAQPRFAAAARLVVDTSDRTKLKIAFLSPELLSWFGGLIEEAVGPVELKISRLIRRARDERIRQELGGPERERIYFSQALAYLATADQSGWHVFYILDSSGVLRAVSAGWSGDGWGLRAGSVGPSVDWRGGVHFVSRNS